MSHLKKNSHSFHAINDTNLKNLKTVLDDIKTNTDGLETSLSSIDNKTKLNHYTGQIKLSGSGASVYADTSPTPTSDNDDREGWLFTKTMAGSGKFNYYFYSQGSNAMTLDDLTNLKANITIDNYQTGQSLPFFVVYTKPTGTGDAGAWYHSRRAYTLDNNQKIFVGQRFEMYSINQPQTITGERQLPFNNTVDTGDALGTEEILTVSIQSDSGAPQNTKILVESVGLEFGNVKINYKLTI
jgi:hypothetical protein